jgi:menaquinone-dependent protoporphyrinogen IX oxidase
MIVVGTTHHRPDPQAGRACHHTKLSGETTIRVLVTAASKHGATAEIAGVIAEHLTATAHDVDLREPDSVHELENVDAAAAGAREHRVFAGHVNKDQLGYAERAMVRAFRATVGDFGDWEEIADWARDIDGQLRTTHP